MNKVYSYIRFSDPRQAEGDSYRRHAPGFLHDNAWNQSLFKVLALQALHGWERYIICFKKNPSSADAKHYAEAGLV